MILRTLTVAFAALFVASTAYAASWDEIREAGSQSRDWLNYGGDIGQLRFVPSDAINKDNVNRLRVKWIHQSGVVGSNETTPIVENGVMYLTTPFNHVFAIDAASGREIWHYEHKLGTIIPCCGPNNRGVAIAGNAVYMATLDAMLVALDKRTGELLWETEIADSEAGYSETHAPVIYKDMVILGIAGAEYGIRGFISAYNKDTGDLIWRTHLIPAPDEASPDGVKGWEGVFAEKADGINPLHRDIAAEKAAIASGKFADSWKRGGASEWMTPSVDPVLGLVIATTGNPSPDLDGSIRPGDNRWSDSLVALDVETGEMKWAYQYVPHDVWDLDAVSPPILIDVADENGNMVPGVVTGGKTGWVYVHDRRDGHLIRRSAPMVPHDNLFALPTEEGVRMLPGANGGVEWSPGAFNPDNRLVYYVNLHQPMNYITHSVPYKKGALWLGSAFVAIPGEQQWGNITAVNVDTGEIAWQTKTEQPMIGGALVTAGGVVFAGEGNGLFKAYDADNGDVLWSFQAGAGVNSAPMAFEIDGKLYIAVASGGVHQTNFKRGDSVLVFSID